MSRVNFVLALTHQTGRRLAEIGFLLLLFAGVWLAAAQIPQVKLGTARTIIAGIALAIGGLLLIIATRWVISARQPVWLSVGHCGSDSRLDPMP